MSISNWFRPDAYAVPVLIGVILSLLYLPASVQGQEQSGNDTPRTITIEAKSGLKYRPMRFRVDPGQSVRLILKNTDRLLHNMLITQPGKRPDVVNSAMDMGANGKDKNYAPDSKNVLWNIRILDGGEQAELRFQAPEKEDVYPYVCTLPGHGFTMYGAMYVQKEENLPPVAQDPHLPDRSPENGSTSDLLTPLPDRARVYREFLPEASPAVIAVSLPTEGSSVPYSYAFDAARCRLRYAWYGGFIDVPYTRGDKGEIQGEIFYRNTGGFPIRFGSPKEEPDKRQFLGYSRKHGRPTFRYRTGSHRIEQTVNLRSDGPGIVQQFHISNVNEPVWFMSKFGNDARLTSADGSIRNGSIKLSPEEASTFSVTIIPTDLNPDSSSNKKDK